MRVLIGALLGVLVAAGVLLAVHALTSTDRAAGSSKLAQDWRAVVRGAGVDVRNAVMGAVAGLVLGLVMQMPVMAIVGAVIGLTVPPIFAKQPSARVVARGEAIETWVRGMAGMLVGGVGLQDAIRSSLPSTPELIRPEVTRMVARLQAQQPIDRALRLWADEMNDRTTDLVAATLLLGAETRRGGMAQALRGLTESLAEQNRVLRRIEADRSGVQMSARLICIISLGMLMFVVTGPFGAPYRDPLGQVVLIGIALAYAAVLRWMRSIISIAPRPRFLSDPAAPAVGAPR